MKTGRGIEIHYNVNTGRGSSGAPVFNAQRQIVGVHTNGGDGQTNQGVDIDAIREESKTKYGKHSFFQQASLEPQQPLRRVMVIDPNTGITQTMSVREAQAKYGPITQHIIGVGTRHPDGTYTQSQWGPK